jgi:hypothetical protein
MERMETVARVPAIHVQEETRPRVPVLASFAISGISAADVDAIASMVSPIEAGA